MRKIERPFAVPPIARIRLRGFIESKPWAYQDEIQDYLFDVREISESLTRSSSVLLSYFVFFGGGEPEEESEDSSAFESYL